MSQPIQQRVEAVRSRAMRLVRQHGAGLFAGTAIAIVFGFGLLDYLLRFHDPALRWLMSLLALGLVGLAGLRLLVPAFRYRTSLIQTAQRIEQHYPQLGQRLSSAIDFLGQAESDRRAGSPALRRAVIAEAEALSADLDFSQVLNRRELRRALLPVVLASLGLAGVAALNPGAAQLALGRLLMPWSDQAWPRRHELVFADPPARLAVGDSVELAVLDRRGELPATVEIQIRRETPGGAWRTETSLMKPLGERMVYRLDNVAHPFAYRARGGDDDTMPWRRAEVVQPPKLVALEVQVAPPAYTGLAIRKEGRVVRALIGSRLRVRGQFDKPIQSAVLRSEQSEMSLPDVEVAADGRSFVAPPAGGAWPIEHSAAVWLELTDEQGMVFGRDTRLELHAVADAPPSIAWEAPADHTLVTARALVPVKGLVKDDLAIRGIQLRYLRPGSSEEEQIVELYTGPPLVGPPLVGQASRLPDETATTDRGHAQVTPGPGRGFEGETVAIDYAWDLSRLAGLSPGDVLAVRITAEDYKPQLATSIVRRLTIITAEELENRVAQRQGAILSQLGEALRLARQAHEQTESLAIRVQETGRLEAGDLNHLQAVQHNQHQVHQMLGTDRDGAEGQITALLAELAANRVTSQALVERLNELLGQVQTLNRESLPAIDQQLTEAFKSSRQVVDPIDDPSCADAPADVVEQLRSAGGMQEEVVRSLENMLGSLSQWDSFSRLAREIGQIRSDEQRLADETEQLRLKALAAATGSVPAVDRALGRQLSQRQLELARRLDKVHSRMEDMLRQVESDPLTAGTLADALDAARRLAIGGRMREAASRLGRHELGQALQLEQAVLEALDELLAMLSTRRDYELARTASSLRDAATELGALLQQARAVQREIDAAATEPDSQAKRRRLERLQRELQELAERAAGLSRQLQRLRARRAAAALDEAAASARSASQAAGAGDADTVQEQAREAEHRLEDAEREVARAVAEAEEELAREQRMRVEQAIAGLAARQKNVLDETARIDGQRSDEAPLDAAQQAAVRNLASEQRLLADETDQLRPSLAAAEAFAFALEGAAERMERASGLLTRGQTATATQEAERSALTRLEQILSALKPDEPPPMEEEPQSPPADAPAGQTPPGNTAAALAELKLLKALQEEINRRTSELAARRIDRGTPEPAEVRELDALAREQGRLADMLLNLIAKTAAPPDDDLVLPPNGPPERPLPEPRDDEGR